ncbi:hypothetical protein VTP01DRAFT_1573 [Rhizomucor pusillus]|uniref:uncharacterized protein n=1 Tax=Rhizomucor pusillus TaxID=4840 RepID=UPI0037441D9A
MDDMYQYAASAARENEQRSNASQGEEDDVILQAFKSFDFRSRWTSLVDTVKKQSEEVVNVTRKDLQEFAQVLRSDTTSQNEQGEDKGKARATTSSEGDDKQEEAARISGGLWSYIQKLPAEMSSIRLPENIDLKALREEMDQGTRFAEQYLQTFGSEVMQILNKTITVLDPEEQDEQSQGQGRPSTSSQDSQPAPGKRIYANRKDALLAEVRTNPDTFLKEPEASTSEDKQELQKDVEKRTDEIAKLLEEYPELRDMMDRLVPVQVSYTTFWQRYFYHLWKIEKDEEKRRLIVKGVQDEDDTEEDFQWDSEDEEASTEASKLVAANEAKQQQEKQKQKQQQQQQSLKGKEPEKTEQDSDSDWE